MITLGVPAAWSQVQAGKVRMFAVLSRERSLLLPNVPIATEEGIDNFVVAGWYGLLAPAGTPRDIVNRLSAEWGKIVLMPDTKEQMLKRKFFPFHCSLSNLTCRS
jgi:tripartite-type tricarboxylate transporter receptor subunit TctC